MPSVLQLPAVEGYCTITWSELFVAVIACANHVAQVVGLIPFHVESMLQIPV